VRSSYVNWKRVEATPIPLFKLPPRQVRLNGAAEQLDAYTTIIYTPLMLELISLPDFEGFDWSKGNAEKNWQSHQVSPAECEQVFFNSPLLTADDKKHSVKEKRWFVLGQTDAGRELLIAFTMRAKKIRVISARDMHRKERAVYRSL